MELKCSICGVVLNNGAEAYATTIGNVYDSTGGFAQNINDKWLTVACRDCGMDISIAILQLIDKHDGRDYANLY